MNLDRFPLGVWETDNSGREEAPEDPNAPDNLEIPETETYEHTHTIPAEN